MFASWSAWLVLCGPLRMSVSSAFKSGFNAEDADIRRGPQRILEEYRAQLTSERVPNPETNTKHGGQSL
jgi:hypothetical protein